MSLTSTDSKGRHILLDVHTEKLSVGLTHIDFKVMNRETKGTATWRMVFEAGENIEDLIYSLDRFKGWIKQIPETDV